MNGWISIHRKITENPIWLSEQFTRAQAWIDLLIIANHKDGFIMVRGNKLDVKRGQVGWSLQKLANRWRWSIGKANRFINELQIEGQIDIQKNRVSTVITIVNYEQYQNNGTQNGTQTVGQTGGQTGGQTEHRQTTNNNDNNDNKKKRPPSFLNLVLKDHPDVKPEYTVRGSGQVPVNTTKKIILAVCKANKAGEDEARWYYNKMDDAGFYTQKGFPMKIGEMVEDLNDLFRRKYVKAMTEKEFKEING
jgi:hypothetical protein